LSAVTSSVNVHSLFYKSAGAPGCFGDARQLAACCGIADVPLGPQTARMTEPHILASVLIESPTDKALPPLCQRG
jgi:hypothetical protein